MQTNQISQARLANAVFFFISGFGYSAWASRIPTLRQELHLSDSTLGTLLFAMPVGLICTLPITNYLLSRYSSRRIMICGSIAFNILLCLAGFATGIWQLAILLVGFGSSRNLLNLSMNAQAVSVQRLYSKSIITAFHGIWSIAGFSGAALGYLLTTLSIGTEWHFPLVGVAMTVLTIWFGKHSLYEKPDVKGHKTVFSLPDKSVINYAVIVFICMACENTMYDWSGVYFQKTMNATQSMATAAFAAYMVMMTTGRFLGDRIVNKIGIQHTLYYSSILLTSGFIVAIAFPYPATGFLGFMMTGLGVSCISPLIMSLAGRSVNLSSASVLASISSISYLGFLMVPPSIGFISEAVGIRFAFGVIATLAAVMVFLISRIRNNEKVVEEHTEEALI
jgi:MFS family permease